MAIKIINLNKNIVWGEAELKQPPKFVTEIKALKKVIKDPKTKQPMIDSKGKPLMKIIPGKWIVSILHPNTKAVIHTQEVDCSDYNDAFSVAEKLKLDLPKLFVTLGPYYSVAIDYKTKKETKTLVPGSFLATYTHPTTLEPIYSKQIVSEDEQLALQLANQADVIETEFYERRFFSSPKKGKTKLHTEKGVIDGDMSDEDFENLDEAEFDSHHIDAEMAEFNTKLLNNLQKQEAKKNKTKGKMKERDKKVKAAKKVTKDKKTIKKGKK